MKLRTSETRANKEKEKTNERTEKNPHNREKVCLKFFSSSIFVCFFCNIPFFCHSFPRFCCFFFFFFGYFLEIEDIQCGTESTIFLFMYACICAFFSVADSSFSRFFFIYSYTEPVHFQESFYIHILPKPHVYFTNRRVYEVCDIIM